MHLLRLGVGGGRQQEPGGSGAGGAAAGGQGWGSPGSLHTADDQQQLGHALQVEAVGGVLRDVPCLRGTCGKTEAVTITALQSPDADQTQNLGDDRELRVLSWQQCYPGPSRVAVGQAK